MIDRKKNRTWASKPPAWLNWKWVGLAALLALLIFIVAAASGGDETPETPPPLVRLRDVARLSTIDVDLSTVVKVVKPRGLGQNEVLIYGVCGRVVAGVDLSKLQAEDVRVDGRDVHVRLPRAEIFALDSRQEDPMNDVPPIQVAGTDRTVEIAPVCDHVFSWEPPPLMSRTAGLDALATTEAVKAFRRAAEEQDILAQAQAEAQRQLERLLLMAGYEHVTFEVNQDIETGQEVP